MFKRKPLALFLFEAMRIVAYRRDCDRLNVRNGSRATKDTDVSRERRLEAWLALLALEGLDEGSFFSANVGAGTAVHEDVEVVARAARVLADEPGLVGLVDGDLHVGRLVVELAADVDVR